MCGGWETASAFVVGWSVDGSLGDVDPLDRERFRGVEPIKSGGESLRYHVELARWLY